MAEDFADGDLPLSAPKSFEISIQCAKG
jgi:hypothetical protein